MEKEQRSDGEQEDSGTREGTEAVSRSEALWMMTHVCSRQSWEFDPPHWPLLNPITHWVFSCSVR